MQLPPHGLKLSTITMIPRLGAHPAGGRCAVERLGVFDQFFYKADQYKVISMIMGGATILAPARPRDRLDADAIADHLAARLSEIPLLRVKLVQDPLRLGTVRKVDVEMALGLALGHDITEILPEEGIKHRAFRRGHIIVPEDVERLVAAVK